ncbi:MAG: AAA family ATPase [Spirochaetales bacterium]|nr:AAA family ATPase [Spirochaetales bacterium]
MSKDYPIQYISSYEAASVMEKTPRYITHLCQEGRIPGAFKDGKDWKIPKESLKNILLEKRGPKPASPVLQRKKPPVIGNTMYTDVVTKGYYVDKTLMIRDILDDVCSAYLFTRPRRFGKTLNLNMIKTFFEISDSDTSIYFRDKKIWSCGKEYQEHQGQYPVIYLSFKDVKYTSWEETFMGIKNMLLNELNRHKSNVGEIDIELNEPFHYSQFLLSLSLALAKDYSSPAVILIDEYDTPIQQGFEHGFYDKAINFLRNFFSAGLKDNPNLAFGILTGILRVSKENLFSGLNNLMVNTVLDEKFSEYFGFTTQEVIDMASYYGKEDKIPEIRTWYDGYNFGGTEIYNPWSVNNYFYHNCKPAPYWVNTSSNGIIRELLLSPRKNIIVRLYQLLQGKSIPSEIDMNIIYPRLSDDNDAVFSFLMLAGYLKPAGDVDITTDLTLLTIPNKEVQSVFKNEVVSWIGTAFNDTSVMKEIKLAIFENDILFLKQAIEKYMKSCISYFDTASESFYHGMMLGLLACLSQAYRITSNRESGNGRFDIQMDPLDDNLPAVIIELKVSKDGSVEKLKAMAEEAIKQINEKHYGAGLGTNILKYGIAFHGKDVEIESSII